MKKTIKRISTILFWIYITAVILLCLIQTESLPELPKTFLGIPFDKIAHFIMFMPFVILGYSAFQPTEKSISRELAVLAIFMVLGCAFAIATEKLQAMTSYRSYEISDMAADSIGLITGSFAILVYIIKTHK